MCHRGTTAKPKCATCYYFVIKAEKAVKCATFLILLGFSCTIFLIVRNSVMKLPSGTTQCRYFLSGARGSEAFRSSRTALLGSDGAEISPRSLPPLLLTFVRTGSGCGCGLPRHKTVTCKDRFEKRLCACSVVAGDFHFLYRRRTFPA